MYFVKSAAAVDSSGFVAGAASVFAGSDIAGVVRRCRWVVIAEEEKRQKRRGVRGFEAKASTQINLIDVHSKSGSVSSRSRTARDTQRPQVSRFEGPNVVFVGYKP